MDLTKKEDISVQIRKVGSDPYCEMSIDSAVKENINVAPGTKARLSFLDCPSEDLRLTTSKTIGKICFFYCAKPMRSVSVNKHFSELLELMEI